MKRILYIIVIMIGLYNCDVNGQQIHQLTNYNLNDFVFNPAIAGSDADHLISKFSFRKQWTGIDGSPTTGLLSTHLNLNEKKSVGLGAIFYFDSTGPTKRTGIQLAYSYHLPINKKNHLAFGLSGSILQYSLDFNQLSLHDENDQVIGSGTQSKWTGDANFGMYFYGENYWAGASVAQLMQNKIRFNELPSDLETENVLLNRHFYFSGGYKYEITDDIAIEPSVLLKIVKAVPLQADITARAIYKDQYWLGLTYRTQDAIAIALGVQLNNGLNIAYSYDITTSGLNRVSGGSHEVSIGYDLKWRKKKDANVIIMESEIE